MLGTAGIFLMSRRASTIHPIDAMTLGASLVVALTAGVFMGRIVRFRVPRRPPPA